ncbi:UNVERIFIED_CONTAM: hypothetical protein K2H54_072329 [Gekko kuhli]
MLVCRSKAPRAHPSLRKQASTHFEDAAITEDLYHIADQFKCAPGGGGGDRERPVASTALPSPAAPSLVEKEEAEGPV